MTLIRTEKGALEILSTFMGRDIVSEDVSSIATDVREIADKKCAEADISQNEIDITIANFKRTVVNSALEKLGQ